MAVLDREEFTLLFKEHHKVVYAFALKLTRSESLAEEIVQEVFLKIWVKREDLSVVENFKAYLSRVTRNHSYNVLRDMAQATLAETHLKFEMTEITQNTQHTIDYRDASEFLEKAVNQLPPQQKLIYTLCHKEGLKYEEVAKRLNISPATVHSHMKQALRTIRAHFKKMNALVIFLFLLYQN
jgi:RNA polymerase sigma-70 factor (family 1)